MKYVLGTAVGVGMFASLAFAGEHNDMVSHDAALFDFNLGSFDLSAEDDNDSDFDNAGVTVFNGQARFRLGSVIGEIQGTTTTSVDDTDEDENSSSFGMFGHYVTEVAAGDIAFGGGITGGTNVEESDGTWYTLISVGYSQDDWMVGLGNMNYLGGQESDDSLQRFTYVQGSYSYDVLPTTSVFVAGYYGNGATDDDNTPVTGYNGEIGVRHDLSDRTAASFSVGRFGLLSDGDPRANGTSLSLGVTVAIGSESSTARDAIRFDVPNLHREITWCDEASC